MNSPIEKLRTIVARLRAPDGCPWDREQTHATLRGCLIEEAHEVVEAINENDPVHFREELGDLLLQVVMHAQIASEAGHFDFDTVAEEIGEKMVRRHPHVFGDTHAQDSDAVLKQWDQIKRAEKGNTHTSVLDGISIALPALTHAEKIAKRAARIGFDWAEPAPVIEKIREELAEVEEALNQTRADQQDRIEDEIGDLLFAVANLARKVKVEPEVALKRASSKFSARFRKLEARLKERGIAPEKCTLAELDEVWDEVKLQERAAE
jgi:MazG family protein